MAHSGSFGWTGFVLIISVVVVGHVGLTNLFKDVNVGLRGAVPV